MPSYFDENGKDLYVTDRQLVEGALTASAELIKKHKETYTFIDDIEVLCTLIREFGLYERSRQIERSKMGITNQIQRNKQQNMKEMRR